MKMLNDVYGVYNVVKFWIIVTAISGVSAFCLPIYLYQVIFTEMKTGLFWFTIFFIVLAAIGLGIFPFAIWQHRSRKRFFDWLESQWTNIDTGAVHPDGYTITLDTPLVRYEVVFSVFLATVSFTSRPYVLNHPTTKIIRNSYILFSLIFGWWFLGTDGVIATVKALIGNLNLKGFTLRELLKPKNTSESTK